MRITWSLALATLLSLQGALSQTLSGIVIDAKTGIPLASVNVLLNNGERGTSTDQSGFYSFPDLKSGTYRLRVTHIGYTPHEATIDVTSTDVRKRILLHQTALPGPEVVVSAIRAEERLTPVTFSQLNLNDLRERHTVQDIPVLLSDMPSSTFYSEGGNGIGYNYLRIRGFDQRRLSIMINGIPQNDPEDHNVYWIDFADLLGSADEIQVQRGAGSAFYGPPAIGGSINIVTGDFVNEKGIRIASGIGSYGTNRYALSFGSGLIDDRYTLFGRLSRLETNGYRDHSWVKANTYYFTASRYDETVTTRVNVFGGPIEDGLVYFGLPKFAIKNKTERKKNYNYWETDSTGLAYAYAQSRRPQEREEFSQPHFEVLNEWKVADVLTFNSALFYVIGQGFFDYDGTGWTDASYYRLTPEFGFESVTDPINPLIRAYVDNRQFGWLPRMTLQHDDGTFTSGFELRRHRSLHWGKLLWAEGLPKDLDPDRRYYEYKGGKDIVSLYAQELFRATDRVHIMANVQYVFNRYHLYDEKYVGTTFTHDYHFINPRAGVNFNLDEQWNFYGNVSFTQREPRLKNLYDAAESSGGETPQFEQTADSSFDFSKPLVKPEQLLNLEIGSGLTFADSRILINGFVMDFKNEIIKSGQLDKFGQPITGNASRTLHIGIEASVQWLPLPYLELDANALLSRSRLVNYTEYQSSGGVIVPISLNGNRIAGFPERLANVRITWRQYGFSASLALKYVGDQYTDNYQSEENNVDPYTIVNMTLSYNSPAILGLRGIDVKLVVNNLFDTLYAQSGEGNQYFVGAERYFFFDIGLNL